MAHNLLNIARRDLDCIWHLQEIMYSNRYRLVRFDLEGQAQGQMQKTPITCLILPVELRNALDTYRESCMAIDIDGSDFIFRLKVKAKVKAKCRKRRIPRVIMPVELWNVLGTHRKSCMVININ